MQREVLCCYFFSDLSIPKLDKVMVNESESLNKLEGFIKDQVEFEKRIKEKVKDERVNRPYPDKKTECVQPKYVRKYKENTGVI